MAIDRSCAPGTVGGLFSLDIVAGFPLGELPPGPAPQSSPRPGQDVDVWAALEDAVLPALEPGPAVVSFSGGRDSSLVLAAAVSAARRHGLAGPVAVSMVYPDAPSTFERPWQEQVVRYLGVADWETVTFSGELDFLGDVAGSLLLRHGLRYPSNAHTLVPVLERASGGAVLTGIGGDDLLGSWRWSARSGFLSGAGPRNASLFALTLLGGAPAPMRRVVMNRRANRKFQNGTAFSWLTERGRGVVFPLLATGLDQPPAWPEFLKWACRQRVTAMTAATAAQTAADYGTKLFNPLLAEGFVAALGRAGGKRGFHSRTAAMSAIAEGHLPPEVIGRQDKALFHEAFFGPRSRAFAQAWDGGGVDSELVSADALRRQWLSRQPDFRTALLLQQAWLAAQDA